MNLNNQEQFLRHYDAWADAIFRHCYFRISDREKAKDLTQEAFIRAWRYGEAGEKIENFRALLYRIANNLIIDEYRKSKSVSLETMRESGFEPASSDDIKLKSLIDGKILIDFLNQLDEKYRVPILMRYVDDLTPKEIAEALGETEGNVSVRIHRGIKQVQEILNHHGQI